MEKGYIKELREQAEELIEYGNSKEKAQGQGMLLVLNTVKAANKAKVIQQPWFYGADKVLKDGYWYVKISDIPFGDV